VSAKLGALVDGRNAAAVVDVGATVVNQSATGIQWGKGIQAQGLPWEDYLQTQLADGSRLPANFKTFDFFDQTTGEATSAKTLDTTTQARMDNPSQVYTSLKGNIDAAADFEQYRIRGVSLTSDMITSRTVEVAVPAATTPVQWTQIASAMQYAATKGVNLIVTAVK
jgi:filamentous hemagglutinin